MRWKSNIVFHESRTQYLFRQSSDSFHAHSVTLSRFTSIQRSWQLTIHRILLQSRFRTRFHVFYDGQRPRSRFANKTNSVSLARILANLWIRPCVSVQRSMENESTRCGKTARGGSLFRRFLTCHREVLPFSQMLSTCSFTLRSSALSRFFGSEKRSICRHWSLAMFPYLNLALYSHSSFFLSFLRFRLDRVVPTSTKIF